jgi:hypothetical protein
VVKGYVQRYNIDYDEVFMPATQLDSVRLLITLVAHEGGRCTIWTSNRRS